MIFGLPEGCYEGCPATTLNVGGRLRILRILRHSRDDPKKGHPTGSLRILSNFPKGVYQVGCPFPGSSWDWRGIVRILSYFSKGVYHVVARDYPGNGKVSLESEVTKFQGGRVPPFLGSSWEWRGVLRILLSNFSKGVYKVGCLFLGSSRK